MPLSIKDKRMRIYCKGCGKRVYTDEEHSLRDCKEYMIKNATTHK